MGIEDFQCTICKEFFSPIHMGRFESVCDCCEAKYDEGERHEED